MALRTLVADGVEWTVWDVVPSSTARLRVAGAKALAEGWLVFDCATEKRRLVPTPVGWDEWPDAELEAALRSSGPARREPLAPVLVVD